MWLKKIELKSFKRFSDFPAQFGPGINVVKGPLNEMGKSTLLEGVIVGLFGNPKSTARELRDYVSWGSTGQTRISIEFEDRGNTYLLEKDFDKGTARLVDGGTQREFDTFRGVSQRMAELLGTSSDTLFLCSSCIRQSQVSEISSGKKEISESLEEVVTGGKESTLASQVIQKLDDKISEMRKGLGRPAKAKGILASLKAQQDDCVRTYNEVREEVSRIETQKIELLEVNKQLTQVKEHHENAKALLEKNVKREKIEMSMKELERKYDELEEMLGGIDKLMTKLEEADGALKSIEGFVGELQVSEAMKKLDAIQNKRGDTEKDLTQRENELAEAKVKLEERKSVRFFGSGKGMATALAILTVGVIGAIVVSLYFLSLAILGVAFFAVTRWASTALVRDETSVSDIEERLQKMREALGELDQGEKELLAKAKCATVAEFDRKEKDFTLWLEKRKSLEARLEGMLRGKTIEDFQKQKREVAKDLAVKQAELTDDLKATCLNPEEYVELERKVQALEATRNELEDRKRDSIAILKAARYDAEEQVRLEEELERLQEALEYEERKDKALSLAREFISKARSEVLSSVEEALEKQIARYLTVFTDGKYSQVEVNKETLEFGVYSDEKGDWVKPEDLSGGVIDEFYLAFRLALVKLIYGDKKPPLILDDPFVNFDSARLANTLDFFRTLAPDYQIIIFTLGDSYDKVAGNIVLLGENAKPPVA